MIRVHDLQRAFGERKVLCGLAMTVDAGEVVIVRGANGAGKSTLFRCLLGVDPYAGEVRVDGLCPACDGASVRARIGYMPQVDGLDNDLSTADVMAFFARLRGLEVDIVAALAGAGLSDHAADMVGSLSRGMRQRLSYAIASLGEPRVLLLDEPFAGLDVQSHERLRCALRARAARGTAIVLATHGDSDSVAALGRTVVLEGGRFVAAARSDSDAGALHHGPPGPIAGTPLLGWTIDASGRAAGGCRC